MGESGGGMRRLTGSPFRFSVLITRLFTRRQLQAVALKRFEAFNNFIQREFVSKIDLIINFGTEPVYFAIRPDAVSHTAH